MILSISDSKNILALSALFLVMLLSVQSTYALGVTRPVPHDVQLMEGEEAGFRFQIQAVTSTTDVSCTYSMSGLDPLQITFEQDEVTIAAGAIKDVFGTVFVPQGTETKLYNGKLSVSCGAAGDVSGSAVKTTIGDSPFNVEVVEERERDIREVNPPAAGMDYTLLFAAVVIIIAAIISLCYFIIRKRKVGK